MKKIYVAAALGVALAASFAIPQVRATTTSAYRQLISVVSASNPSYTDGSSGALSLGTEGALRVKGAGSAGSANTGVMTVQGIASMTPLFVQGPALSTGATPIVTTYDNHGSATYRFSASFTPTTASAVTLASVQGSATKTVRIKKIFLSGHSTANAQETIALQRTSALGAGGTAVNPTAAKLDTNSAAATAVVAHYTTTAKAGGTGVGGPISTQDFFTGVVTTPTVSLPVAQIFPEGGAPAGQAIVLRGTADFLELQSVNAGNLSAGTVLQYTIELDEE